MIRKPKKDRIDKTLDDTFPASDPPSWMGNAAVPGDSSAVPHKKPRDKRSSAASGRLNAARPDGTDHKSYSRDIKNLQKNNN